MQFADRCALWKVTIGAIKLVSLALQVLFFTVPVDYFRNVSWNNLPIVDRRLTGRKCWGNLGPYLVSIRLLILLLFKAAENVTAESNG
jgi:hypothetical protein